MNRIKCIRLLAGLALCIVAGCTTSQGPVSGYIVTPDDEKAMIGMNAPSITFVNEKGKGRRLQSLNEDAMIIAFVDQHSTQLSSPLVKAVQSLKRKGVDVALVEVVSCDKDVAGGKTCILPQNDESNGLISLCDKDKVMFQEYGVSESRNMFLLNAAGEIIKIDGLSKLDTCLKQAEKIYEEAEEEREELYSN